MENTVTTNNNNNQLPPTVSKLTSTGFTFDQEEKASTLVVGDRRFTIKGIRLKDFGDDKFRDISLDKFDNAFIAKIQAMIEGHEEDFKNLTEFTITIEESSGLSETDFIKGQKSHYFFDPRSIGEKPTHAQLFTSGKLKCRLCYNKNGQEIRKNFFKKDYSDAEKVAEFAFGLKKHCATADQDEDTNPISSSSEKKKTEERKAPYSVKEPDDEEIKNSKREEKKD